MSLTKAGYKPRIIDAQLDRYLKLFGAIVIEGPKWCGKTWTALNKSESAVYIMNPSASYSIRETAKINPSSVLGGEHPSLIDEWQEVPAIWDAVRFAVDQTSQRGQYILTGSTKLSKQLPTHSGAGRMARLRMRPMSLYESGDSTGEISLVNLFNGSTPKIDAFSTPVDIQHLIDISIRGGWPENVSSSKEHSATVPRQYIRQISESDISNLDDDISRDSMRVELLIKSLARNISTTVSNSTLQNDIQNGAITFSKTTLLSYLTALKKLYVLEEAPGWAPAITSRIRVQSSPKRYLADPSLVCAGLRATHDSLSKDLATFGRVFENLCYRDLCAYADAMDANIYHYRDNADLEIDMIVDNGNSYAGLEVKLNPSRTDEGIKTLKRFREKMLSRGNTAPAFLAVLTGGGICATLEDGIHVVPITVLKN